MEPLMELPGQNGVLWVAKVMLFASVTRLSARRWDLLGPQRRRAFPRPPIANETVPLAERRAALRDLSGAAQSIHHPHLLHSLAAHHLQ